jgi:hypothetical protein
LFDKIHSVVLASVPQAHNRMAVRPHVPVGASHRPDDDAAQKQSHLVAEPGTDLRIRGPTVDEAIDNDENLGALLKGCALNTRDLALSHVDRGSPSSLIDALRGE